MNTSEAPRPRHSISLAETVSAITVLVAVAYFLGWIYLWGYFGVFDSLWLLDQVSQLDFLKAGVKPILLFFPLFVAAVVNFPRLTSGSEKLRRLCGWSILAYIGLVFLAFILNLFPSYLANHVSVTKALGVIFPLAWFAAAVLTFSAIYMERTSGTTVLPDARKFIAVPLLLAGLIYIPFIFGALKGLRDIKATESDLPEITLRYSANPQLRLLWSTEKYAYLVDLDTASDPHRVYLTSWDNVISVHHRPR